MHKEEYILAALRKIEETIARVISYTENIDSHQYYYLSPAGMERLESTCMLLIAIFILKLIGGEQWVFVTSLLITILTWMRKLYITLLKTIFLYYYQLYDELLRIY